VGEGGSITVGLVLGDILRRNAAVVPERPAYVYRHDGHRTEVTYRELEERSNRVANAILGSGVAPGDRVAFLSRNNSVLPIAMWGAVKAGCIAMPLNFRYTASEVGRLLATGLPSLVMCEAEYADVLNDDACAAEASVPPIITFDDLDAFTGGSASSAPDVEIHEDDPHILLATSGTTGTAKGVLQSHRVYFLQTGNPVFSERGTGEVDIGLCSYQLFHSSGWRTCMIYWRARATVVFVRHPRAEDVLAAIAEERVTQFAAVPETLRELVTHPATASYDLSSVQAVNTGTSAISSDDLVGFRRLFGGEDCIRIHYGASEAGPVTSLHGDELADRPRSVGRPTLHVDVRIVGADGSVCNPGCEGEITVRSDFLMLGYWNAPELTAEAIRDGWYHTGDLGYLDEEGYLFVTGRVKEMIRSGGETIFPAEVEECVRSLAGVVDCGVAGIPDQRWGEAVGLAVVADDPALAADEVRAHVRSRLAAYKVPKSIVFVDAIPRTEATAKVQRAKVRALLLEGNEGR
jgi:fatty-acyl-CoA synthase